MTQRPKLAPLLCVAILFSVAPLAVLGQTGNDVPASQPSLNGLTGSFNQVTKPFKYLFTSGPIYINEFTSTAKYFNIFVYNSGGQTQQYLAEAWKTPDPGGVATLVNSSGVVTIGGDSQSNNFVGFSYCTSGCSVTGGAVTIKVYTTGAHMSMTGSLNPSQFQQGYDTAGNLYIPAGGFQRSVLTASFSFGSSAGVCATTPENSIKVHNTDLFPGSPAFGDYGWQASGSASNTDACSGSAFADLFLRSSANISGPGKWTFTYEVPNGAYDVTILYNTSSASAGDTTITLNGRTVVNAESSPASNLSQTSQRINVGGNQILVGISSAGGTAVLNGVIVTPLAQ